MVQECNLDENTSGQDLVTNNYKHGTEPQVPHWKHFLV